MKKLICLIAVVILLSIPVPSMAKSMYFTERVDNMLGEVIHTLHVPSTDELSEITIEIGSEGLITLSFESTKPADCEAGYHTNISFYYTNISFGFDAEEAFTIPFYCPDLHGNFVYSPAYFNSEKIIRCMKSFDVLWIRFYHNDKPVVFNLKDFRSIYNLVHMYNRLSNNK